MRVVKNVLELALKLLGLAFLCEVVCLLWAGEGSEWVALLEKAVNHSFYLIHSLQIKEFKLVKLLQFTFLHHFYYLVLILILLIYYNKYRENLAYKPSYTISPMIPLKEFPKKVGEETSTELAKLLVDKEYRLWKEGKWPEPTQ